MTRLHTTWFINFQILMMWSAIILIRLIKKNLTKAEVIVFSPGPGSPKNYPISIKYL